jgi:hypothetical protein
MTQKYLLVSTYLFVNNLFDIKVTGIGIGLDDHIVNNLDRPVSKETAANKEKESAGKKL